MNKSYLCSEIRHAAIIMDGNGRWAKSRSLPRIAGHRAGAEALRNVVEAAPSAGVTALTVYAFSADNWKRPAIEVRALMSLFARYLKTETPRCIGEGVRVSVIGRRDRLDPAIVDAMAEAEAATRYGKRLHLRLAVDYSAREAILRAVEFAGGRPERFEPGLTDVPPVDLLIRTGGEQRLSDFLLWECAYAELFFTPVMWPDFTAGDLRRILHEVRRRERRFGGISAPCEFDAGAAMQAEAPGQRWLR